MEILSRQEYIQEVYKYLGKQTIIVLTGQRRVGKSYVLLDLKRELSLNSLNNVIFIDKEKKAWKEIKTDSDLNDYIDARIDSTRTNFILIDEVQEITDFENSLRNYRTEHGVEIIVDLVKRPFQQPWRQASRDLCPIAVLFGFPQVSFSDGQRPVSPEIH